MITAYLTPMPLPTASPSLPATESTKTLKSEPMNSMFRRLNMDPSPETLLPFGLYDCYKAWSIVQQHHVLVWDAPFPSPSSVLQEAMQRNSSCPLLTWSHLRHALRPGTCCTPPDTSVILLLLEQLTATTSVLRSLSWYYFIQCNTVIV